MPCQEICLSEVFNFAFTAFDQTPGCTYDDYPGVGPHLRAYLVDLSDIILDKWCVFNVIKSALKKRVGSKSPVKK